MNEIAKASINLPDNIEDLTKFVLVGREKLTAVRAEIRAIDKIGLAQEVREQKREECLMLSEALLDAEVRIGDLLKQIPKNQGFASNPRNINNTGQQCPVLEKPKSEALKKDNAGNFETTKPKSAIITELGFNEKQAQRFETLADNKDLVEQVKQEARENDDIPTRSRVLDLAAARKKRFLL